MTTANDLITVARTQLGYVEQPSNITRYWAELDPGLQGQPWCGALVSWVFQKAGAPLPNMGKPYGFVYCPNAVHYAQTHNLFSNDGQYDPGDIVLYGTGGGDHTGIVVSDNGSVLTTIEGNTSPEGAPGSQTNGGGVYLRHRSHGPWVFGVLQGSKMLSAVDPPVVIIKPPVRAAPRFPLPAGSYFGPKAGGDNSVSGYYGHRSDLRTWQNRMASRGWVISADGLYGDQTMKVARAFQDQCDLLVDGLIGPATWAAAWTAKVT